MSTVENTFVGKPNLKGIPTGPDYKAQLKFYDCQGNGECSKVCPEQAITEGPKRMPAAICVIDGKYEMLPGRAVINEDKCTGCGDCIPVCPETALEMVPR